MLVKLEYWPLTWANVYCTSNSFTRRVLKYRKHILFFQPLFPSQRLAHAPFAPHSLGRLFPVCPPNHVSPQITSLHFCSSPLVLGTEMSVSWLRLGSWQSGFHLLITNCHFPQMLPLPHAQPLMSENSSTLPLTSLRVSPLLRSFALWEGEVWNVLGNLIILCNA